MFKKKKDKNSDVLLIMTGLLLTIFLNSYLVGLWGVGFNLSADDGLFSSYTTAQTIMIALFEVLSIIDLKSSSFEYIDKDYIVHTFLTSQVYMFVNKKDSSFY